MELLQKSLTAKLLTLFLLMTIVPISIISYMAYSSGRQSIVHNVESHLESVAILKEQEIKNWVNHLEHTITWLTNDPETINDAYIMSTHAVDDSEYIKAHDSLLLEFKRITDLAHFSPVLLINSTSGRIIASSDFLWEGKFRESEPYFIQGKTEMYMSDIFQSRTLERPTMVISTPIKDSRGELLGVLVAHANLEHLTEIMQERSGLGETGETFLVNSSNLLITNTVFAPDGAFKKWIFGQGVVWALEGKTGVGLFTDYRGVPVIGAYRWMDDLRLVLIAKQDRSEAFASIHTLGATVLGVGILVVLAVALLSMFFARVITRPIYRLTEGAEIVGTGNLDYKVGTAAKDEIGILSRAFDKMTENLKEISVSRNELAKEVVERKRAEEELSLSEQFLSSIIEQSPISLWISDSGGTLIRMNQTYRELFGITDEEAVGKYNILNDNLIKEQGFMHLIEDVFEKGENARFIIDYDLPRGEHIKVKGATHRILDVAISPIKDTNGKTTNALVQHKDITDQKRVEEEIGKHRDHLEKLVEERTRELRIKDSAVESSINAIVLADLENNLTYVNHSFLDMWGYDTGEEVLGRKTTEFWLAEEKVGEVLDALSDKGSWIGELTARKRDGSSFYVQLSANMVMGKDKEPICMMGSFIDITEFKEMQQMLLISERLATLGQFSGSISHELRNPLGVIDSSAYFLKTKLKDTDGKVKEHLERIRSSVNSANNIIQSILDLTRMEKPKLERLDLTPVTSEAIDTFEVPATIKVVRDFPDREVLVDADREQLGMTFKNIIKNAVEVMDKKGTLTVSILTAPDGRAEVSFADTGTGIAPEDMERVFQPLFSTKPTGIGFGLSISKMIIERHGGTIEARAKSGVGTTFTIKFPPYKKSNEKE